MFKCIQSNKFYRYVINRMSKHDIIRKPMKPSTTCFIISFVHSRSLGISMIFGIMNNHVIANYQNQIN